MALFFLSLSLISFGNLRNRVFMRLCEGWTFRVYSIWHDNRIYTHCIALSFVSQNERYVRQTGITKASVNSIKIQSQNSSQKSKSHFRKVGE
jgi:hypothetical protein